MEEYQIHVKPYLGINAKWTSLGKSRIALGVCEEQIDSVY